MKNKILSMMLCASLIFTMLAQPQIQPPAHAEAVTLTVSAVAVVLTILAACGITFASTDVAKKCIQQFAADVPDVPTLVSDILGSKPEGHILSITAVTLPKVKQLVSKAINYFKGKTAVQVPDSNFLSIDGLLVTTLEYSDFVNAVRDDLKFTSEWQRIYNLLPYDDSAVSHSCTINGVKYDYRYYHDGLKHGIMASYPSSSESECEILDDSSSVFVSARWGFYVYSVNGVKYCGPVCFYIERRNDGTLEYRKITAASYALPYSFPYDVASVSDVMSGVAVNTIDIGNVDDVNEAIAHSVGKAAEGIQADIQSVIDAINAATATDVIGIDAARELLGIKDELKELEREQERIEDAIKEGTKEDDMDVPKLPATITDKFPFCVPFDLIALVKTFSATPEAPKVTVPVVFDSMHYSHDFVFDFSGDNWDKVAAVIRWGTLIFFILGLTLVTRKLIKG